MPLVEAGGPPRPVQSVDRFATAELAAICEKAMARSREARYASVRELGDDLQAYLENRVVRAYRTGALAELLKWVARNKGMAASIAAALFLALAGLVAVIVIQEKARRELTLERDAKSAALQKETAALGAKDEALAEKDRALGEREEALRRTEDHLARPKPFAASTPRAQSAWRLDRGGVGSMS
ncbi:MAG: hypothetical protein HY721_30205 [Planctomycetes bacterium]|nr:hypothetical protein [Planctomycetota bacterium]